MERTKTKKIRSQGFIDTKIWELEDDETNIQPLDNAPLDKEPSLARRDTKNYISLSSIILRDFLFNYHGEKNNINAVAFNYHDLEDSQRNIVINKFKELYANYSDFRHFELLFYRRNYNWWRKE